MKFYDKATITVVSGKWGDWVVSARREAWVPYGGPAWWNGGRWGSVVLVGSPHVNTLVDFHFKKKLVADNGDPGRTKEQYGKQAENLIIELPLGSIVRDVHTGKPLWQCYNPWDQFVICRGGQWGVGNMHFKNAINQYPQFALLGEPWETREIEIELQLLADIALIGTPSVGKSSLINAIANVKAKVADYPFTTLIPNLGSVKHRDVSFNVVDVPGLIAGASHWKGLGNEFLRHIMKARVLCFMLDMSRYERGIEEFGVLFDELLDYLRTSLMSSRDYGIIEDITIDLEVKNNRWQLVVHADTTDGKKDIFKKDIVLICNKVDAIDDADIAQEYLNAVYAHIKTYFKKTFGHYLAQKDFAPFVLSTYSREGVQEWLDDAAQYYMADEVAAQAAKDLAPLDLEVLDAKPTGREAVEIRETTDIDMPLLIEEEYVDVQDTTYAKVRYIKEREVCRLVYMLPWWNDEAEMWFWNVLDKKRLLQKLISAGLVKGDIIHVQSFYSGVEDRFIRY